MRFLIILVALSFINSFAQDDSIKNKFKGKWKMVVDNSEVYEEWEIVNDTELNAKSYFLNNDEKIINESVLLKKFEDYWMYIALPENQTPAMFILKDYTKNKFTFENKEHDFPQRIIYEFYDDDKLTAAIEGETGGKLKRKEFHFVLVQN
jgi:hypothetical protein